MAEGMDRPWATFDALPVDLIQRIAAMIPDSSDPVTQRWVLALYPCTHANLHVRYVRDYMYVLRCACRFAPSTWYS